MEGGARWLRIGVALTKKRGPTQRQDEFQMIIDEEFPDHVLVRFCGFREQREDGEAMVGLASAGPNAWWNQPMIDFKPGDFVEVRRFKKPIPLDGVGH
jgi:hypothetical protein